MMREAIRGLSGPSLSSMSWMESPQSSRMRQYSPLLQVHRACGQKQRTDEEERGYGTSIRRFTRLSTLAKEGQKRRGPAAAEAEAVRTLWTP